MSVKDQIDCYDEEGDEFDQASDLRNILRNVQNGGYNEIPVQNLLADIEPLLKGFDGLIVRFKKIAPSVKNVHSKSLNRFLEKASSIIMAVYEKEIKDDKSEDKEKAVEIKEWLKQQSVAEEYLEENGHLEW